jgi:peptidoglycan/xylan/chitin deacetylase (PgdA/CDA1 family)
VHPGETEQRWPPRPPSFELTLTFDNGPTAATPIVLDLLGQYQVKATFFVCGKQMVRPALREYAERAHADGHWIGNHTFSHGPSFGNLDDPAVAIQEIEETQRLIGRLAHPDRWFRPYANSGQLDRRVLNQIALDHLQDGGYSMVLWNSLPRDWETSGWVEIALAQCEAQPWSLMVLHDNFDRALPGLERFLPAVLEKGGRFRQDFPPGCVPIRKGDIITPVDHLLRTA